nr:MAG TPA: hypothetical protein [Bacteriophage sp.]
MYFLGDSVKGGARPLGKAYLIQRCEIQLIKVLLDIPQNIIAFSLDSRYKRYLPIWDKGIPIAC